ncbi:MAG: Rieske (2Fe-2S) protein [Candidatus Nanohaloarchaea archaeon]
MEEVADAEELEEGEMVSVEVDGEKVMVVKADEEFYAIGDVCTHEHCLLSDGWLEGKDVVCPCHSSKFDLETGEPDRPPAKEPEPTYEVEVRDGKVLVEK